MICLVSSVLRVWIQKRLRVYIRVAGIHGDVSNVHMEVF